jgi:hypothetical protein
MFTNAGYGAPPGFLPEACSQETPLLGDAGLNAPYLDPVSRVYLGAESS